MPYYNAALAYAPNAGAKAAMNPEFASSFAFFLVYMGVLVFIFLICSMRTNLVFFLIFALLVPAFSCLAGAFWYLAEGDAGKAARLQYVGAGLAYAVCILGWYLFLALMLAAVDFPINVPLFDLSHIVKGGSEIRKAKKERTDEETSGGGRGLKFWKKKQ